MKKEKGVKMSKKKKKTKETGPAAEKRAKIAKAKKVIMGIVLMASLALGLCLVLAIHFIKYINFNSEVISAKDKAIKNYEQTIQNIGICGKPKGSNYTIEELKKCSPNTLSSSSLAGTLRYAVMEEVANNTDLESVARESDEDCYTADGDKIDYKSRYEKEEDEEKKAYYLGMVKMCSSLRVIPDAIPSKKNVEALLASLNQIFIVSNWDPESLSPYDDEEESPYEGVGVIPLSLGIESSSVQAMKVLLNMEKSIRTFDITSATVEWQAEDEIALQAKALAYYIEDVGVKETQQTVYASKEARKAANSGSK